MAVGTIAVSEDSPTPNSIRLNVSNGPPGTPFTALILVSEIVAACKRGPLRELLAAALNNGTFTAQANTLNLIIKNGPLLITIMPTVFQVGWSAIFSINGSGSVFQVDTTDAALGTIELRVIPPSIL